MSCVRLSERGFQVGLPPLWRNGSRSGRVVSVLTDMAHNVAVAFSTIGWERRCGGANRNMLQYRMADSVNEQFHLTC